MNDRAIEAEATAKFLEALAGDDDGLLQRRGAHVWSLAVRREDDKDLAQAVTIAEAAWRRRAAAIDGDRVEQWSVLLAAAEEIVEAELARLLAPTAGKAVA